MRKSGSIPQAGSAAKRNQSREWDVSRQKWTAADSSDRGILGKRTGGGGHHEGGVALVVPRVHVRVPPHQLVHRLPSREPTS